jgi:integrase/recombinase XerD
VARVQTHAPQHRSKLLYASLGLRSDPFESNPHRPYSTRRIRQLVKQYAAAAGIAKRVYPHLFRHQLITYLTKQGIISLRFQLLSGHTEEQSLVRYRELALSDVSDEYEAAMQTFPVR